MVVRLLELQAQLIMQQREVFQMERKLHLRATTPGGSCAYTASVTINVADDPVATIDTLAPGDTICSGDSIQITAEPAGLNLCIYS